MTPEQFRKLQKQSNRKLDKLEGSRTGSKMNNKGQYYNGHFYHSTGEMNNDYSVLPHEKGLGADLAKAEQQAAIHKKQLDECQSDWAYWSILSDLSYWEAIVNILKAAELVGPDNLPDVTPPNLNGSVVMDAIGRVEDYGKEIYRLARLAKVAN
jgi:hypothetical protein